MKRILSTITILLLLAMHLEAIVPARAAAPTLSLTPAAKALTIGQTFDVSVIVNTDGQNSDAADAVLYYEPAYLEVVDANPGVAGIQVANGTAYTMYPGNDVDPVTGRIRVTGFNYIKPFNGTGVLATITFKAIAGSNGTPVVFDFVAGSGAGAYVPGSSQESNIVQSETSDDILAGVSGGMYSIGPDTSAPYVINLNPQNNAVGISPATNISFTVVDDLTAVDINSLAVNVNGTIYTATGANRFSYSGSSTQYAIVIDPMNNFNYLETVNMAITGADTAGNSFTYNSKFTIGSAPVNLPPVIIPIPDKPVTAGTTLHFLVTATDPNPGDQLTLSMAEAPAGMTLEMVDNGRGLVTWTPTAADVGTYQPVTFTVVDNGSPLGSDTRSMAVAAVAPIAPVAAPSAEGVPSEAVLPEILPPAVCGACSACGQRRLCEDNRDNNGDGTVDFPADPQCVSRLDNDEGTINNIDNLLKQLGSDVISVAQKPVVKLFNNSFYSMASATGTGSLSLLPSSGTFFPGQIVNVTLRVETGNTATNAVDAVMHYDPAAFEVIDALPEVAGIQIQPGTIYEAYPGNVVNPVTGEIKLTAFSVVGSFNSGTESGVLATIQLRALQATPNAPLTFDFTPGVTTDSNIAMLDSGVDMLTSVVNGSFSIAQETNPPSVSNFVPANGSANRSPAQTISFRIQDAETGVNASSVHVLVNGIDYSSSGAHVFTATGSSSSYQISLDPTDFAYGSTVTVAVTAQDTQGNAMSPYTSFFTIMAEPTNAAPVLQAIPGTIITAGSVYSALVRASDPDTNDVLSYSLTNAPAGMVVTKIINGLALIEWSNTTTAGKYYPTVVATDNGSPNLNDSQILTIIVATQEQPPIIDIPISSSSSSSSTVNQPAVCPPCPVCPQCLDKIDNDRDGLADYPADPGCLSPDDTDETDPLVLPICFDSKDNDGDGLADYPYDPGCLSAADEDETDPPVLPVCSDTRDNDGDGLIDYPSDPGCLSAADNDETDEIIPSAIPACGDGIDNDGDGLTDMVDPGCLNPDDALELDGLPAVLDDLNKTAEAIPVFLSSRPVQSANSTLFASVVVSLGLINLLAGGLPLAVFFMYLLSEPIRALLAGSRKPWGVVYNSLTKRPMDLVVVRVHDSKTDRLLQTRVTNIKGEFYWTLDKGTYYIVVDKNEFAFPSHYLQGKTEDGDFEKLYFGQPLEIGERTHDFTMSIPIDPAVALDRGTSRGGMVFWKKMQRRLSYLGVLVAVISFLITPKLLFALFVGLHIGFVLVFRRLSMGANPRSWGKIRDERGRVVKQAIVRIFDKQYNKLLETVVTGRSGNYGFLVGPNVYFFTVSKPGYETYRSEFIDLTGKGASEVVAKSISLKKISAKPGQPPVVTMAMPTPSETVSKDVGEK